VAGLTVADLLQIAERVVGPEVRIRDRGLLVAALARVEATDGDEDVYGSTAEKAAALLHSLVTASALAEGNRPFALAAALTLMAMAGEPSAVSDEDAVALVTEIVTGRVEAVPVIAHRLAGR